MFANHLNHIEECFNNIRVVELEANIFARGKAETVAGNLNAFISVCYNEVILENENLLK